MYMNIKVCIVTLAGRGGMIHYASQIANAISKVNNGAYIIIPEHIDLRYFGENVTIVPVPLPERIYNWKMLRFYALIKTVSKIKPDVIHITEKHPWLLPFLFLFKKRCPIVTTIHDIKTHPGDWELFLWSFSLQTLKKYSDKLIVHGDELKTKLISEGILENKIVVIPHGDYLFFTEYKKHDVKEENAVLFFGRIYKYKGVEYLIKAEPLITKHFPNIKIIIAGRGTFSKHEKLIEHKRNFEINNKFIPDEQVAELFQRSKIVVLPYIEASQSGVIPIAYAFKKPVVVTNVGSIPEIVDGGITGFIVPPRNPEALAKAIIRLLKDENLRKEMGKNAYKKLKRDLSWDKIAEKTIEVYKEAINEHENKRWKR